METIASSAEEQTGSGEYSLVWNFWVTEAFGYETNKCLHYQGPINMEWNFEPLGSERCDFFGLYFGIFLLGLTPPNLEDVIVIVISKTVMPT